MSLLLKCPKCESSQWFEILEYSQGHIIIACSNCKIRLWSGLEFVVVEE